MINSIATPFTFSQSNLQNWLICRRRFLYADIQHLAYPAPVTQPLQRYEQAQQRGEIFHQLAHQYALGIAPQALQVPDDEGLQVWWQRFLQVQDANLLNLPLRRFPETLLLTPLGEHVLLAKADLIAVEPRSRFIIADWKSGKPVPSQQLATHIQSRVYRYVAVLAGSVYNDGELVHPEQVEMIYWFAQAPTKSVRLPYSVQQFNDDHQFFLNLVRTIQEEQAFPTVFEDEKERVCRFCVYRTRCWHEVKTGELTNDQDFPLDLELSWDGDDLSADAGGFTQALESEF